MTDRIHLPVGEPVPLPAIPGWDEGAHLFEPDDALAVEAAHLAGRPLLVRGEPGTGKTQLARAVAQHLGWALVSRVVTGLTELEALFWEFDAVERLSEAQVMSPTLDEAARVERLNPGHFLSPGPLWWAFDWEDAERQHRRGGRKHARPHWPRSARPPGVVLLIDEIDKADLDVPNGLLEAFGQGSFQVRSGGASPTVSLGLHPVIIIITTNEERELPRAFLRRCLVLQLEYPDAGERETFNAWLRARARAHFTTHECEDEVLELAAELIRQDRLVRDYGGIRPGLAEYLDLVRIVTRRHPGEHAEQRKALERVSTFVRRKQGRAF